MRTPKKIRYLTKADEVQHGDFIRQGDGCFEYCTEFGSKIAVELRYRKTRRIDKVLARLSSLFGREGFWRGYKGRT